MRKEILIKGRKITYFEEGKGPPFLIIHGWGGFDSAENFLNFQHMMAKNGFGVFLPNFPGFKENDPVDFNWKIKDYADFVIDFMGSLGIKKFYLMSHSFGGVISIKTAATFPENVLALVLCSPAIAKRKLTFFQIVQGAVFFLFLTVVRILHFFLRPLAPLLIKIRQGWLKMEWFRVFFNELSKLKKFYFDRKMAKIVRKFWREENATVLLKKIKSPTLVIWGGKDFWNPLRFSSEVRHIPDFTLKIIPKSGHSLQKECPEKLAELITDFIKNLNDKKEP